MLLLMSSWALAGRPVGLDRAVEPEAVDPTRWAACVDDGACTAATAGGDGPVQVSYAAARDYCRWQGGTLPTVTDVEALGVSVPAHMPTTVDEWVAPDPDAAPQPWVRLRGTKDLVPGSDAGSNGVRCVWQVTPVAEPALPELQTCLTGRRRVGEADTTQARGATDNPWTCAGLSVWIEMPRSGSTWLDHWTGTVQSVVGERSDGSFALTFRRRVPLGDDEAEDAWFLEALMGTGSLKRKGPIRKLALRDLDDARRATYRVRMPEQREGRIEAIWLAHGAWDLAMVVGPGQYGARADLDEAEQFFRSIAPSLVPGWRLGLPAGGWFVAPPDAWSDHAPILRPDRVRLTYVTDVGEATHVEVHRAPIACDPQWEPPAQWGVRPLGAVTGVGWTGETYKAADDAGAVRWVAHGCATGAQVHVEVKTPVDSPDALNVLIERLTFPTP